MNQRGMNTTRKIMKQTANAEVFFSFKTEWILLYTGKKAYAKIKPAIIESRIGLITMKESTTKIRSKDNTKTRLISCELTGIII